MVPSIAEFQAIILDHWREAGRSFPWRETADPWAILVSEIMLQQTQTDRVISYWTRWLSLWPTPAALAAASLEEVLREWSGLGYNRRARFLREAALAIVERYGGVVPATAGELESLPGIGPYTARAVACFAFGQGSAFIETNIRSVFLHFFFPDREEVPDAELFPLIEVSIDQGDPRRWYWALMDYGANLKRVTKNPSRRSRHHVKQSKFSGSLREARGAILRELGKTSPLSAVDLSRRTGLEAARIDRALVALSKEGFVAERDAGYGIAGDQH